jgi:hypothetical protein
VCRVSSFERDDLFSDTAPYIPKRKAQPPYKKTGGSISRHHFVFDHVKLLIYFIICQRKMKPTLSLQQLRT